MRHLKKHKFIKNNNSYKKYLLNNLSLCLLKYNKIITTLAKAKALRPFVEKIITLSIKAYKTNISSQKLHFIRLVSKKIKDKIIIKKLFTKISKMYIKNKGGYTRIYKLLPRKNDGAHMALIELINKKINNKK